MNDLERSYAALADEADRAALTTPAAVRARGDRRQRVKVVAACAAVLLIAVGVAAGARWASLAGPELKPGPSLSPTVSPTPPPATTTPARPPTGTPGSQQSATSVVAPSTIPDRAFLRPIDVNAEEAAWTTSGEAMPDLCGTGYNAARSAKAQRFRVLNYWSSVAHKKQGYIPSGSFVEGIRSFRGSAAEDYLDQVRQAVQDCPKGPKEDGTVRILPGDGYGDESFTIEYRHPATDVNGDPTGGTETRRVSVVRIGGVVLTLYERGYEGSSMGFDEYDAVTKKAVQRLRSWLPG